MRDRFDEPGSGDDLSAAVARNDLVAAAERLRAGDSPNAKDALGYTPLMISAGLGHAQMVELLLTAGADVHILDSRMGASALHKAAQGGVIDCARLLIRRGAHLDLQAPTHGFTPLMGAAWHKRSAMVVFLVEQGAIVSLRNHQGQSALDMARAGDHPAIVGILEEGERAAAERSAGQRLHAAARSGYADAIRDLIAQGADLDETAPATGGPDDGHTPLMIAARDGHAEVVRVLLAAGAGPRIVDHLMKATPGHKAGYQGRAAVARALVEHGSLELDAQGPYNGYTALHDAVWHGHAETAQVYVEAGARLDLRGHEGWTPLEMAQAYGYPEIASALAAAREARGREGLVPASPLPRRRP